MKVGRYMAALAVVGLSYAAPAPARAETIAFQGVGNAGIVGLGGLVNGYVYAGELNWSFVGAAPQGFSQSFYSYCVDVLHALQSPQSVTIGGTDSLTGGNYVAGAGQKAAWLFNTYAAAAHAVGASVQAAALQVAIWEALYDTTLNLNEGNIRLTSASSAVMQQAATYLRALAMAPYQGSDATLLITSNGQSQVTVPEPSTVLLIGTGLLLLLIAQRKGLLFQDN